VSQGRPNCLAHRHDRRVPSRRNVLPDVQLDTVRDCDAAPHQRWIVVLALRSIGAGTECWSERAGDATLEGVTGEVLHLSLDGLERGSLALPDLDGEELEKMPVVVCGRGAGTLGPIQKPASDVKPHRARAWSGTRRRVRRAHTGRVDQSGHVRSKATRIPGRVSRVRTQQ
jgi:hypothetical protein